jgi:flagellar motility protein MotE (MotC chaperone)
MNTWLEKLKQNWKLVLGVLAGLVGLFLFKSRKNLLSQLETAETNKQDAILETKKDAVKEDIKKLEAEKKELKEKLDDNPNKMTDDDILSFYNKKS